MQIILSDAIRLQPITINDQKKLFALMESIYPPAYNHLWVNGDCSFYLNLFYSKGPLQEELSEKDADYHFVVYNEETIGIVRAQYNQTSIDGTNQKATYVNRIYLGRQAQGKGVAKQLLQWVTERALLHENHSLWLKAMDTQEQALRFYKKEGFEICGKTSLNFELLHESLRGMFIMQKEL